jgi:hypothetical protein
MRTKADNLFVISDYRGYIPHFNRYGPVYAPTKVSVALAIQMITSKIPLTEINPRTKQTVRLTLQNLFDENKFAPPSPDGGTKDDGIVLNPNPTPPAVEKEPVIEPPDDVDHLPPKTETLVPPPPEPVVPEEIPPVEELINQFNDEAGGAEPEATPVPEEVAEEVPTVEAEIIEENVPDAPTEPVDVEAEPTEDQAPEETPAVEEEKPKTSTKGKKRH